jgi:hypothetical protein
MQMPSLRDTTCQPGHHSMHLYQLCWSTTLTTQKSTCAHCDATLASACALLLCRCNAQGSRCGNCLLETCSTHLYFTCCCNVQVGQGTCHDGA